MISKEEVKKIAKLARLAISEKETAKYQKELSLILDYIEKMEKADVSKVEPTSHPFSLENVVREDKPEKDECANLVEMAPDKKDNYVKVKSILK
ncbi:MAG: Asp-tRNA(Asn)/Glu-tRNA(Gln) amidotransferase subunit GatC [Candidatus Paceibacterota bacterium]|jgi:aspartyl-tRNA(Asn)/glutamyl-tRNA(Gln) amidotransferase subunit C